MISKRSRRSTGPQENLKQFSLNNSKGVDETKPIIDPNTVSYMKNLTVNLDGSLSLRKPMKAHKTISGLTTNNIFLMFTEKHYLLFNGASGGVGFSIVDENGNSCRLVYEVQDYYTNELTTFTGTKGMNLFDTSAASCINTADSTVIGNSYIYAQTFSDTNATTSVVGKEGFTVVDASLYDDMLAGTKLPRYLQITKHGNSENTFKVAVKTPEINTLTTAEGEPSLNPNMTLDNPYAVRDVYTSYTQVLGILLYKRASYATLSRSNTTTELVLHASVYYDKSLIDVFKVFKHSSKYHVYIIPTSYGPFYIDTYTDGTDLILDLKNDVGTANVLTSDFPITVEVAYLDDSDNVQYFPNAYTSRVDALLKMGSNVIKFKHSGEDVSLRFMCKAFSVDIEKVVISNIGCTPGTYISTKYVLRDGEYLPITVSEITENSHKKETSFNFKLVDSVSPKTSFKYYFTKAFCKFTTGTIFSTWEYFNTSDLKWYPIFYMDSNNISDLENPSTMFWLLDVNSYNDFSNALYVIQVPNNPSPTDDYSTRPDVLPLELLNAVCPDAARIRFRLLGIDFVDDIRSSRYVKFGKVSVDYGSKEYVIPKVFSEPVFENNLPNAVLGDKYYYKKSIYSYGVDEYSGVVHVSNPGSFITPLYNILEVGASAKSVPNSIVPWRDYIITFTENDVSLSSKTDTGFYTKTISTSVGVPFSDRKCPNAALNGIIFKSGRFVYFAYPNLYSGDDTSLTLTNISRPIQSVLDSLYPDIECFAEVVDDMYLLMVPDPEEYCTLCLRYSLTDKHWEIYEYPVRFLKFLKSNYAGAVMYGVFNDGTDYGVFSISESGAAYDIFTVDDKEIPVSTQPIAFMLDTGQKTDSISNTKQFVESKLVFATLDDGDSFPFTTHVAIDGDPHIHTVDVSTDSPFWKPTNPNPDNPVLGVLGTSFGLGGEETPASGKFNTLRQLVIRYSGKGKSIRHVIEGESQCNFKLYETYVRYKNLNGK